MMIEISAILVVNLDICLMTAEIVIGTHAQEDVQIEMMIVEDQIVVLLEEINATDVVSQDIWQGIVIKVVGVEVPLVSNVINLVILLVIVLNEHFQI